MRVMPDDDFILPPLEREKHDELELIESGQAGVMRTRVKWERRDSLEIARQVAARCF